MRSKIQFFLMTILLLSCSEKLPYESRFVNYLKEIHNTSISGETLIISFSGNCGACDKRTISLIHSFSNNEKYNSLDKIVIIPKTHQRFSEEINNTGFQILIDKEYNIPRYGIDFEKNMIIHFKSDKKIKYWNWLYLNKIYDVEVKYGLAESETPSH